MVSLSLGLMFNAQLQFVENITDLVQLRNGVLYDPSDSTSLFRNVTDFVSNSAQGTTGGNPSVGEAVGTILDVAHMGGQPAGTFIAQQENRVPNGDFSSGVSDWSVLSNATFVSSAEGALFSGDGGVNPIVQGSPFAIVSGGYYMLTVDLASCNTNVLQIAVLNGTAPNGGMKKSVGGAVLQGGGVYSNLVRLPADWSDARMWIQFGTGNSTGLEAEIRSIALQHVPGYGHATADTNGQRPTLTADGSLRYLHHDGVDDALVVTAVADLGSDVTLGTATAGASTVTGGQTVGAGSLTLPTSDWYAHALVDARLSAFETSIVTDWLDIKRGA